MQKSEEINELATALTKAQGGLEGAKMDGVNPFFKAKYATLASVWDACRKPLTDNGLSVVQTCSVGESEGLILDTTLLHTSGQWISGELAIKPTKNDPQGIGSAITYARRYGLAAIIGICPEDDDAESATEHKPPPKKAPAKKPTTKKKVFDTTTIEGALEFLEDKYPKAWGHTVVAAKMMGSYGVTGDTMVELIANLSQENKEKFSTIVSEAVMKANK